MLAFRNGNEGHKNPSTTRQRRRWPVSSSTASTFHLKSKSSSSSSSKLSNVVSSYEVAVEDAPASEHQEQQVVAQLGSRAPLRPTSSPLKTLDRAMVTQSLQSQAPSITSFDILALSPPPSLPSPRRKMASKDRTEGHNLFGRFTRRGRRGNASSSSLMSLGANSSQDSLRHEVTISRPESRRDSPLSFRKRQISEPYNFQHVLHTRQEQFPDLERATPRNLINDFIALRSSQAPTHGELKGINTRDLNFHTFPGSSNSGSSQARPRHARMHPAHRQHVSDTRSYYLPQTAPVTRPAMNRSQSVDNLSSYLKQPISPPRTVKSPLCPIEPPVRTSSRSASVVYRDRERASIIASIQRPNTSATIRRPDPPSPDRRISHVEQSQMMNTTMASHAVTTPGDEAWPVPAALAAPFGPVVEVEPTIASRRHAKQLSSDNDLRSSRSVPSLQLRRHQQQQIRPGTALVDEIVDMYGSSPLKSPARPVDQASWEADVDYSYDQEAEAHCDYNWAKLHQLSMRASRIKFQTPNYSQPRPVSNLENIHPALRHLYVAQSHATTPELSPASLASTDDGGPATPDSFAHCGQVAALSRTSSLMDSFTSGVDHLDQDAMFESLHAELISSMQNLRNSATWPADASHDDGASSVESYNSSSFSRESARSTATTLSMSFSHKSQDSLVSLGQLTHQSKASQCSIVDLFPTALRVVPDIPARDTNRPRYPPVLDQAPVAATPATPPSPQVRRSRTPVLEPLSTINRKGLNFFAPHPRFAQDDICLSPVVESAVEKPAQVFPDAPVVATVDAESTSSDKIHGRKISEPVPAAQTVSKDAPRPQRRRANTHGSAPRSRRGSTYMLFPQV